MKMNFGKKVLSLLLALMTVVCTVPVYAEPAAETVENLSGQNSDDKEMENLPYYYLSGGELYERFAGKDEKLYDCFVFEYIYSGYDRVFAHGKDSNGENYDVILGNTDEIAYEIEKENADLYSVTGNANETAIYNYVINTMGLNNAAACGILANIYKESSFNPHALGDSGTSYGICQWHGSRWDRLKTYCSNNGLDSTTLNGQLKYLEYELKNYYSSAWNRLKSAQNSADGAYDSGAYWCAVFEVPQGYGYWSNGVLYYGETSIARGNLAKDTYWNEYGKLSAEIPLYSSWRDLPLKKGDTYYKYYFDPSVNPYFPYNAPYSPSYPSEFKKDSQGAYVWGNCTWYCWSKASEVLVRSGQNPLSKKQLVTNPSGWFGCLGGLRYDKSSSAKPATNSIAVYQGHVRYIDYASDDYVIYSESGYRDTKTNDPWSGGVPTYLCFESGTATKNSSGTWNINGAWKYGFNVGSGSGDAKLLGYIYLDVGTSVSDSEKKSSLASLPEGVYTIQIGDYVLNSVKNADEKSTVNTEYNTETRTSKRWILQYDSDSNAYKLTGEATQAAGNPRQLNVWGDGAASNGAEVTLWKDSDVRWQFYLLDGTEDQYYIKPVSNQKLALTRSSSNWVSVTTSVGSENQTWKVTKEYWGLDKYNLKATVYKVEYDANGGENTPAVQSKYHAQTLTLNSDKPERKDRSFLHWLGSDGNTYMPGDEYRGNSDLTLKAQWSDVHTHLFTGTYYETAHPHKAYGKCSCGEINYTGGETQKVASCVSCYPVTSVTLNLTSAALKKGETLKLTETVLPEDAANKNVTWSSSDTSVATVLNGTVTAVGSGTAKITVKTNDGGKTAICTVTVTEPVLNAKAKFTISETSGRPGDTVKVKLSMKTDEKINAIAVSNISFDSEMLTFEGFSDYEHIAEMTVLPPSFDEEKMAIVIGLKNAAAFDSDICTLEFRINENAPERVYSINADTIVKLSSAVVTSSVNPGKVTVRMQKLGDIDGNDTVDIDDAVLLFRHSMLPELYPISYAGNTDYNHDGNVDIDDAVMLFRYSMLPELYPID